MRTQPRRYLRVLVPVAVVAAAVGLLAEGASAGAGDIHRLAGQYQGVDSSGDSVCLNSSTPPASYSGQPAQNVLLSYNLAGVAATPDGTSAYVADQGNGRINEVTAGSIRTIAGGGSNPADGPALQTKLVVRSVATHPTTGQVYVLDLDLSGTARIRTLNAAGGALMVQTVQVLSAPFGGFDDYGLAVDGSGAFYVAEASRAGQAGRVGRVDPQGAATMFPGVSGSKIAVDRAGTAVYVTDLGSFTQPTGTLTKVALPGGAVTVLSQTLHTPKGVAVSQAGDRLFVAEGGIGRVNERDPSSGASVQGVAGTGVKDQSGTSTDDVLGTTAPLATTIWLAVDAQADVFILDGDNCVLRMVEKMPVAGATTVTTAQPVTPSSVVVTQNTAPPPVTPVPPAGAPAPAPLGAAQTVGSPAAATGGSFTPGLGGAPANISIGVPGGVGFGGAQSAPALGPLGAPTPVIPAGPVAAAPFVPGIPPAPALVLGADAVAAAEAASAGRAAPEADPVKGAPRYTMVASDRGHGLPPILFLTAFGVVGLFGCVVAAATRAEARAGAAAASNDRRTSGMTTTRSPGATGSRSPVRPRW